MTITFDLAAIPLFVWIVLGIVIQIFLGCAVAAWLGKRTEPPVDGEAMASLITLSCLLWPLILFGYYGFKVGSWLAGFRTDRAGDEKQETK